MKFSTTSTELQKVMGNIGGVIPAKSTLPILENFLFHLQKDNLRITATDLDISMSVDIRVRGSEDGVVAIPAKRLFETVRSLPEVNIDFISDSKTNKVIMLTANGEYKLTGESGENYPTLPSFKSETSLEIDNELLRRLIGKTIFAVSSDELRPAMMGIFIQIKKGEIRSAATDGHRLVRMISSKFQSNNIEQDIVIPAKALNLVLKSVNAEKTTITFGENHTKFIFGEVILISRMIEEKYPNYESVIPADNDKVLVVDKNQILSSVRRTALYASSTTHQVRISIKKGTINVSAEDVDFGSEARETLTCDYSAEPMEIGFNSAYIIDILSHIDTDEAMFKLSTPTRAVIIQPVTQKENENLLMLVMPVRLNV
jgi:DNA polymerase-3 subunit beta